MSDFAKNMRKSYLQHKNNLKMIKQLQAENEALRYLLWLRHGCEMSALYGDDGEMQCKKCVIDFKRDSEDMIRHILEDK